MKIKHIMKDGATLDDIRGTVIKYDEARAIYHMIRRKEKWQRKQQSKSMDRR